ncbi:MAG: hypothetical protein ACK439_06060 [Novosphingobium sp.]
MEKVICLLWAAETTDRSAFNASLREHLPATLTAAGASRIRLNLEDDATAAGAHLRQSRGERQHDAVVQFWLPSANRLLRTGVDAALTARSAQWHGGIVAESTIIANPA